MKQKYVSLNVRDKGNNSRMEPMKPGAKLNKRDEGNIVRMEHVKPCV